MKFRNLTMRELEDWFANILGPPANASERSRRIVASCRIDSGASVTGLTADEERKVREAMEAAE